MTDSDEPDVMDQRWACVACSWSGRFGEIVSYPAGYLGCPRCKSDQICAADGRVIEIDHPSITDAVRN